MSVMDGKRVMGSTTKPGGRDATLHGIVQRSANDRTERSIDDGMKLEGCQLLNLWINTLASKELIVARSGQVLHFFLKSRLKNKVG